MNTTSELQNEVAKLRSDLSALRQEFDSIAHVYRDDDGKIEGVDLHSTGVFAQTYTIMSDNKRPLGMITSDGDDGPCISLWGTDGKARVLIRVAENDGTIEIKGEKLETAVRIFEEEGHGHVVVFSPGEVPRAIVKGMEKGGAIAALSPEGQPRAIMHSLNDGGEFVVAKEHALVKVSAAESGGAFTVYDTAGKRGATIMTTPIGSGLYIHPPGGEQTIRLIATAQGSTIALGESEADGKERDSAIELTDLPGHGGQIVCRDSNGADTIEVSSSSDGGSLSVTSAQSGGKVHLGTVGGGGSVDVTRTDGTPSRVLLSAARTGAVASVNGENDTAAFLQIHNAAGMVGIKKGERLQGVLGAAGNDSDGGAIMLTNPDNSNAVNLFADKEGGRIIIGSKDGTTQAGLTATEEGGQLSLFNDLGIDRASLIAKQDTGGLRLRYGGQLGLIAIATERGGLVTVHDKEGEISETFPAHAWDGAGDEDEDEE